MTRLTTLAAIFAIGCSPASPADDGGADAPSAFVPGPDVDVPLSAQIGTVLQTTCAQIDGCHGSGQVGLYFSPTTDPFSSLINVPSTERPELMRVLPGDPLHSYAYLKVLCDGGIEGGCMPGDPQKFHDWIEAGAPTK